MLSHLQRLFSPILAVSLRSGQGGQGRLGSVGSVGSVGSMRISEQLLTTNYCTDVPWLLTTNNQ